LRRQPFESGAPHNHPHGDIPFLSVSLRKFITTVPIYGHGPRRSVKIPVHYWRCVQGRLLLRQLTVVAHAYILQVIAGAQDYRCAICARCNRVARPGEREYKACIIPSLLYFGAYVFWFPAFLSFFSVARSVDQRPYRRTWWCSSPRPG
jgi:hypothetical protein